MRIGPTDGVSLGLAVVSGAAYAAYGVFRTTYEPAGHHDAWPFFVLVLATFAAAGPSLIGLTLAVFAPSRYPVPHPDGEGRREPGGSPMRRTALSWVSLVLNGLLVLPPLTCTGFGLLQLSGIGGH